jgi:hypothetical protein
LSGRTEEEAPLLGLLVLQPQGGEDVTLGGTWDRYRGLYNPLPLESAQTWDKALGGAKCSISDSASALKK